MDSTQRPLRLVNCMLAPLLGVTFFAALARGETIGVSAAQALFEEARLLMLDDRPLEACPKFAESLRLDRALGTLLNLALCHEKQGKAATAYLEYTDAIAQAAREGEPERQALAEQRILALEPRVIRLSIRVAFAPPKGLWVTLDGTRLEAAAFGVALPVDPGTHAIRYGAPGRRSGEISVSATELDLRPELALSELEALPAAKPVPAKHAATSASGRANGRAVVTGALIGGGLATLAFGALSGIQAGLEWSKRNEHCPAGCDLEAKAFGDSAQNWALLSNVSVALGLGATGVGIYLFASKQDEAPQSRVKLTATAQPGRGMISLEGGL